MRRALALLLLSASAGAPAAQVAVTLADGRLGVRVEALAYPATLSKELTSGLTNRLYVQVAVLDARTVLARKVVEIAIRYDLWDQKFAVSSSTDEAMNARTPATKAEVDALLAALPLPRLFDVATLPAAGTLTVRVEVLLNPIAREKARMIRKWVSENSAPEVGGEQGIPMSNVLFNRIFEQFADGSDVAAAWRASVTSAPFRPQDLAREGR